MKIKKAFSLFELSIAILIVGILIGVVIQGTKLYYKMKLASARGLTAISDVNTISDLVLWVDATQEGSLKNTNNSDQVVDGDIINYWRDRNPHLAIPLIFSQSTVAYCPLYKERAINELPSLYFDGLSDGNGDWLEVASDPRIESPKDYSIFAVFTPFPGNSPSTAAIGILSKGHSSPVNNPPYALSYSTIIYNVATSVATASNPLVPQAQTGANTARFGSTVIATATHNSATPANGLLVYVNGTQGSTIGNSLSAGISAVGSKLFIGRQKMGSPTRHFNGYIGEVIMFNRLLTTEERKAVEKYLGKKWGVKLSY